MPSALVIKAVAVLEDSGVGLAAGFPCSTADQFGLDGFEERLNNGIFTTIDLPTL